MKHLGTAASIYCQATINLEKSLLVNNLLSVQLEEETKNVVLSVGLRAEKLNIISTDQQMHVKVQLFGLGKFSLKNKNC